ncbi:MAG: FKBP-type peptidyl-prolyl cis-trans isomerase N-terminal domain-containing protein, partial [bacterium]
MPKSHKEVIKQGQDFLAQNKKLAGVQVTDSGLHYLVLREGKDGKPAKSDTVRVHYSGTLTDGTKFDS